MAGDGELSHFPFVFVELFLALKILIRFRIFIIEGLPTVVMGIATLWLLPNDPEHVSLTSIHPRFTALTYTQRHIS